MRSISLIGHNLFIDYIFTASGHASRGVTMPQRPVRLDMNLSQPNVRAFSSGKKNVFFLFRFFAISEQI